MPKSSPAHRLSRASLQGGLIVSVQAPEGSPMRQCEVIAAMAQASLANGAIGVRLESPEHIGAVRRRCPAALIIGLWKRSFADSSVYITPGWEDIKAVWAAGADVVAIDATDRVRPGGEELTALIDRAHTELGATLMADVDSVANGLKAAALGCAWVGTTLYGYTQETAACWPPAWDLLAPLRAALPEGAVLICEGGIATAGDARRANRLGADAVVVGTAITGVDLQVAAYVKTLAG
ncbi:N-acetylmannosamine-6-phosphate 2-epimerase [Synechococcus sp. CS-602]|uniref:N-acetylmannosamine-6-phosphate 2-epimerase n=1 Tax=Synechococcaceae TaxID=1890426 RepID=UPI0008FF5B4C|nr:MULTISPECIES: N-acetylmannosamine-6-phosphate 2-epimerase [Synechococcaceae]MCT4365538.1 N-acetylmannosamine-6-phosphate 2-epimerase [Candidatus Regnicoccus frigidus MAG-AL1]APD49253.1 acetylmannosamine-6-phosphate 2-epimerase [Synechococcus sp. SynAce01]MCT0202604.1 N-acetylmannosamine-6-phosphate 2-epimerase [Synechococcus sp. CS-603]MCT0204408.1 N-acetylmannosamine-6-phosphate 2-epimerase [Synechococcus sp. CS-602]MCT0247250.1 N-acetylmannosamine-6-phosphate 2-epimerase [Synechococcus sp